MKTIFTPSSFSKREQIGMLPPPLTGTGILPNDFSIALAAAWYAFESMGVR
jgi:hypothetical protein